MCVCIYIYIYIYIYINAPSNTLKSCSTSHLTTRLPTQQRSNSCLELLSTKITYYYITWRLLLITLLSTVYITQRSLMTFYCVWRLLEISKKNVRYHHDITSRLLITCYFTYRSLGDHSTINGTHHYYHTPSHDQLPPHTHTHTHTHTRTPTRTHTQTHAHACARTHARTHKRTHEQ